MIKRFSLIALLLLPTLAQAAEPQLQDATISGNGNTITINNMPVRTSHGTIYRDVTIEIRVDENGVVSFAPGARPTDIPKPIVQAPALPPRVQQFREGTYAAEDGTLMRLAYITPTFGGVPLWTFTQFGDQPGPLAEATWYEGPIIGSPHAAAIRRAGITSMLYSYGVSTNGTGSFAPHSIIGATQTGDELTVVSFRHGCCGNGKSPTGIESYTYTAKH